MTQSRLPRKCHGLLYQAGVHEALLDQRALFFPIGHDVGQLKGKLTNLPNGALWIYLPKQHHPNHPQISKRLAREPQNPNSLLLTLRSRARAQAIYNFRGRRPLLLWPHNPALKQFERALRHRE
jgi:hypothetical protein